ALRLVPSLSPSPLSSPPSSSLTMPSFLDFFRSKKKSGRRSKESLQSQVSESAGSRVSRRQPSKEESTTQQSITQQLDATQGGQPSIPSNPMPVSRQKRETRRRRDEDKFHKPIVQTAEDVRTKQKVDLHLEELHWHNGGVFSNVYRGKMIAPEKMEVAIKKTWPKETVRSDEMIILAAMRRASPRNIIKLLYIFKNTAPDGTECEAFIFGYMPETLDKVIKSGLTPVETKIYIWQLFNGLDFLSANKIAHRDLKPINILCNRDSGELQIGDFGSAKVISSKDRSSAYQVTRYYRPPEMLLGSNHYSHLIDVWSAGCVFGEMIKGRVLFRGSDSDHQMQLIQAGLGTPTEDQLKQMKVGKAAKIKQIAKAGLLVSLRLQSEGCEAPRLPASTIQAIQLLRRILVYNPENRLCGKQFLEDAFFDEVLAADCIRANGRRPDLQRQSDDTMCHQCFERSQKSVRENRVSRMADPPEKEEPVSTKQLDKAEQQLQQMQQPSNNADDHAVDK
ncbi:hypothetical protein PFISCL1PPCAC_21811, partial [Pristionchus fissidentatus]